ncbi:fungal-specific transcription factor domain-containing protein [Hypoxylon argillaceum]|nr:fungal-specific transcription factor domain-containing protein [Hypoxylon argillaceum]
MTEQKPCHNCRKRRLRCDRSVPVCYKCSKTGQRCLGYGQLYRWVDPDGPLGQLDQSQGTALTAFTASESWARKRLQDRRSSENSALGGRGHGPQQTLNVFLSDPLLQDLSASSRYYLSYFASRFCQDLVVHDSAERGTNPFRELIPMSRTYSYLQHIIVAVSAVHYYHAVRYATSNEIVQQSRVAQNALIDALRARQEAIRGLRAIIQERRSNNRHAESQADQDALLATVLFFVNFTLIDSGKDGWKDHLTAAGRLLSVYAPPTAPSLFHTGDGNQLQLDYPSPSTPDPASLSVLSTPQEFLGGPHQPLTACDYVTSDTVAYFIWNCALESLVSSSSPAILTSPTSRDYAVQTLTWDVNHVLRILSRTEANSYHSCPAHLMGVVLRTARITQHLRTADPAAAAAQMDAYVALLGEAEGFDVEGWAEGVSSHVGGMLGGGASGHELRLRCHIAAAYRAAVCLYILLVARGLPAEIRRRQQQQRARSQAHSGGGRGDVVCGEYLPSLPTTEDLAATIARQLEFVPKSSPLFKYTLWPVFLTGVDAVADADRRWVVGRLRAMRDVCPWGMMTSAMETLAEIWKLRDGAVRRGVDGVGLVEGTRGASGVDEDGTDWLARLQGLRIDCLIV